MALRSDRDALLAAWRGLAVGGGGEGWRTIPLGTAAGVRVLAARRFPGGLESVLITFPAGTVPSDRGLPQAKGFTTTRLRMVVDGTESTWLAVMRSGTGGLDMFTAMASDVLSLVIRGPVGAAEDLPAAVIGRIVAWQRFMERGSSGLLSPDEEVGLFGELVVLRDILAGGGDPVETVESWVGPRDGLHDFVVGPGAMEVKASAAEGGFAARIGSLEQLDTSAVYPLFLVAVRLTPDPAGSTLGDLIGATRGTLSTDPLAADLFAGRLLWSGVRPEDEEKYTRRFAVVSAGAHRVEGTFPRLVRANVPAAVTKAKYTVELDLVPPPALSILDAHAILRNSAHDP